MGRELALDDDDGPDRRLFDRLRVTPTRRITTGQLATQAQGNIAQILKNEGASATSNARVGKSLIYQLKYG